MATYFFTCFTFLLSCFCCFFTLNISEKSPTATTCTLQVYLNCTVPMNISGQMCIYIKNNTQSKQDNQTKSKQQDIQIKTIIIKVGRLCQIAQITSIETQTFCNPPYKFSNVCIFSGNISNNENQTRDSKKSNTAKKTGFKQTETKLSDSSNNKINEKKIGTNSSSILETKMEKPKTDNQPKISKNAKDDSGSSNMSASKSDGVPKTNDQYITNAAKNDKGNHNSLVDDNKNNDVSKTSETMKNAKNDRSSSNNMTTSKPDGVPKTNDQYITNAAKNDKGNHESLVGDNKNDVSKTDDQHKNSKNAKKEESQELFVSKSKNTKKQEKSLLQSEYNDTPSSAHFMGYFLTAIVLCIAGYVVFHNKQKIIAFIIEGRNQKRSRRPNSGEYRKLQTSVDDVMSSIEKSTTSHNYIY